MPLRAPDAGAASRRAVLTLAAAAVVLRLPYLVAPEGNDEGGYLAVARQWHRAGSSLYGHYWVDRPPVLIGLFQLADLAGGLPALRLLGAGAAALAVLGVAVSAALAAGPRAAVWSSAVTGALLVSPQLGTVQVNGELLAAPFVAWSIAASLHAVLRDRPRSTWSAAGAGALAVAALLVKQNMVEPLVFGAALVVGGWFADPARRKQLLGLVLHAASGGAGVVVAVTVWTVARGTSPLGVLDAMYAFRLRATDVLATTVDAGQVHRSAVFVDALLTSGLVLVPLTLVWWAARRRLGGPVVWALLATLAWSSLSMLVSGGFWDHYLVELVVPVGLTVGLLASRGDGSRADVVPRLVAAFVIVAALGHWASGQRPSLPDAGTSLGRAIAAAAQPGDTLVSAIGDAQTVDVSGLSSPYPYLWTLPAQVDDPQLQGLASLLSGPAAPTWVVTWNRPTFPATAQQRLAAAVAAHYHPVAVVCGHPVYLHDGLVRTPLELTASCTAPASVVSRVDLDASRW